ncbi:MAG: SAM-dependent methyltransferase [Candidatus Bipolaricaulia bacterium]
MVRDHAREVRGRILAGESLVRAVFAGAQRGACIPWIRVVVRPVSLREGRHWQVSYFDERKDITKNYAAGEIAAKLDELLALPFRNIHVETTVDVCDVRVTKRGASFVRVSPKNEPSKSVSSAHDREKRKVLALDASAPFLEAVGILTKSGRVRADRQGKLRQINEFLRLVEETGAFGESPGRPLHVVDCGCGNAYLTFAVYHYFNDVLGAPADVVGIDVQGDLLERHREKAAELGWDRLTFQSCPIAAFEPAATPDVVVALHACDTATDDALARGIRWRSKVILAAPCCQHELQEQLSRGATPDPFRAVARHGILDERLGDILTDAFRAAILRVMGYRTDVIQFVSTEHTSKNLMIRAVRTSNEGLAGSAEEYEALRIYWEVAPYLERLLGDELGSRLRGAGEKEAP